MPHEQEMERYFRNIDTGDLTGLWQLNQSNVPAVGSVSLKAFERLIEQSEYAKVVYDEIGTLGFLLALPPGVDYSSENYRWFSERYDEFTYIDRVMVDKRARRLGVASEMYLGLKQFAEASDVPRLCCEVNIKPPNEQSMKFHTRLGFHRVGVLLTEQNTKQVALLVNELHSTNGKPK